MIFGTLKGGESPPRVDADGDPRLSSLVARLIVQIVEAAAPIKRAKRASAPTPFEHSVNAPLA